MPYQRKPFFTKMPDKPYDIISTTDEAIRQPDPCSFITTKPNREFLTRLKNEYGVESQVIHKIVHRTHSRKVLATEIFRTKGGNPHAPQGAKIVKGYSRAIAALRKLLTDKSLAGGYTGVRHGRAVTALEAIAADVEHLEKQRHQWAARYLVEPKWWAYFSPVLTTTWTYQAALLHDYIVGCIRKTEEERGRKLDTHGHGAAIFRLLSELFRKLYKHRAFDGAQRLSPKAIKTMVDNVFSRVNNQAADRKFRALKQAIMRDA